MDEDLEKRIQLEELVTVREKFIAENNEAAFHGCPPVHIPEEFKELADKIKQLRPTKKIIYNVGQWFKNTETYELLVIVDIFGEFALLKINTLYGKYELIDNDEKTLEKLTDIINKEPHLKPIYIHIKEIEK
ncbi:MAG: hypothetical protein WC188_12305 [Candidatus Caldatribacteriota bacterium]